jgi:erythromycin esterase
LRSRRPELVAASEADRYLDALHSASAARHLLNYHAAVARKSDGRLVDLLGIRDVMMADNLAYMVERERGRASTGLTRRSSSQTAQAGRVLAFAHNSHLKRGRAEWQLGTQLLAWWPAGAQLVEILGSGYAVIGAGVGVSEENGVGRPEAGTLEARLLATPGPARFIPTHLGHGLPASEMAALPLRAVSQKNPTYFAFSRQSFTDFDWLAVLNSAAHSRGGRALE